MPTATVSLGLPPEANLVYHLQPSMLHSRKTKLLQNKQIEGSITFCKNSRHLSRPERDTIPTMGFTRERDWFLTSSTVPVTTSEWHCLVSDLGQGTEVYTLPIKADLASSSSQDPSVPTWHILLQTLNIPA